VIAASVCFIAGIATVFSFNAWSGWFPLAGVAWLPGFATATVFDLLDYLTSNMLLPLSGFGIAAFAGWVMPERVLVEELRLSRAGATVLRVLLRYVAPAGIALVGLATMFG